MRALSLKVEACDGGGAAKVWILTSALARENPRGAAALTLRKNIEYF